MKILFVDFDNWNEHIATKKSECVNDTERELWNMHLQIPSKSWKLGKTLAEKME